jgi:hypothetical protein
MAHSLTVGGAVNSDDEPETCMEAIEVFPDTNATHMLIASPECEGQAESWQRRHAEYITRTARPEYQNRNISTFPCHVDMSKLSFVMDTRAEISVQYAPNNAAHFSLHFLLEWPDFEIVRIDGGPPARERTPEQNVVCKIQLAHMMDEGKHEANSNDRSLNPACLFSTT